DQELAGGDVDPAGGGVQPQPHPGRFQVGDAAVGQVLPAADLTGDIVGDTADREVGVGVRDDDADLGAGVEFAGPQRGADPRVAAADRYQVHGWLPFGLADQTGPPETGPNMRMVANSPVAVAAAFSSSSSPVLPGDSRCAAIPEPITAAAR